MSEGIIIAIITAGSSLLVGILTLYGVIIANRKANEEVVKQLEIHRAVTDTKIDELTREVREHNNFAKRMPAVETEIEHFHEDINMLKKFHQKQ